MIMKPSKTPRFKEEDVCKHLNFFFPFISILLSYYRVSSVHGIPSVLRKNTST